ncbi:hypothetical protein EXIGLDRAFT_780588 [Exidia glandulosa HHB12029]|uniref:Uncharacterized protein n=1 Tax=Exidia glandulosa HHB12029 TaxID=1314781 RepID=A0A165BJI2_EXIGL|nr:hypothetical protein EXIGLDRAFT_780588 [Exidia glandulosa HHB12029]
MSIKYVLILYDTHDNTLHYPRRTLARTEYTLTLSCHSPGRHYDSRTGCDGAFTTIIETTSSDPRLLYDLLPGFYKPVLTITTDRGAVGHQFDADEHTDTTVFDRPYLMVTIHSTPTSQDDRADGARYSAL